MSNVGQSTYVFDDPVADRFRLETQDRLFRAYILSHARQFCGDEVHSILDLGCGEGQLGRVLLEVYPQAHLVGVDRDQDALGKAAAAARAAGLNNARYVVGDIEQQLPAGPFDLVYGSVVMVHTHQPQRVVDLVYQALRPGGHFWTKDPDRSFMTGLDEPTMQRLVQMLWDTIAGIGAHPHITDELPAIMTNAGFGDIKEEKEYYQVGGQTEEGRVMYGICIGSFHSARSRIAKVLGSSEAEIDKLCVESVNRVMSGAVQLGMTGALNIIARKPEGAA